MNIRRSEERGLTNIGWLQSRHSFSFGDYHDPRHRGYRSLRVINMDLTLLEFLKSHIFVASKSPTDQFHSTQS